MDNPPSKSTRETPGAIETEIDPAGPAALAAAVAAFAAHAGREVRLVLQAGGETRTLQGHIPRIAHWLTPDDPCLMLRPGATDRTHVLAAMAFHLRVVDGCVALARRRHYETEPLDFQRLPAGRARLRLEPLP